MLVDTHRQWQARTGHTILERYGMSETVMLTSNPCKAGRRRTGRGHRRASACRVCCCGCATKLGSL